MKIRKKKRQEIRQVNLIELLLSRRFHRHIIVKITDNHVEALYIYLLKRRLKI